MNSRWCHHKALLQAAVMYRRDTSPNRRQTRASDTRRLTDGYSEYSQWGQLGPCGPKPTRSGYAFLSLRFAGADGRPGFPGGTGPAGPPGPAGDAGAPGKVNPPAEYPASTPAEYAASTPAASASVHSCPACPTRTLRDDPRASTPFSVLETTCEYYSSRAAAFLSLCRTGCPAVRARRERTARRESPAHPDR